MSKRTFIFCDACNQQGIRTDNRGFLYSRRACDAWAWYEGEEEGASIIGWKKTSDGLNICPKCQCSETAANESVIKKDHSVRQFVNLAQNVQAV